MKLSLLFILGISTLILSGATEISETPQNKPLPPARDKQQHQTDTQEKVSHPPSLTREIKIGSEPKTAPTQNQSQNWHEWFWPPIWSNWALVFVALMAARIALRTLRSIDRQVAANQVSAEAAKRSADVADKSLRIVERAWLAVVFDQPFQPRVQPVTPIDFTVKNTGNTVAMLKLKKINAKRWKVSAIPDRQLEPKPVGALPTIAVIFPGDKLTLDGLVDIPFTQTDIDNAVSAPLLFDVYGYVAYDDVFGIRHITRFCQVYNARSGGFDFPREAQPEYNEAD